MTDHQTDQYFETPGPVDLYVETGSGTVTVHAVDTTESRVSITGRDAEQVRVEQAGTSLSVIAPKRSGFLSGGSSLDVAVTVPLHSEAAVRTGSADVTVEGVVAALQVRSGSGEVRVETLGGPGVLETGSGDVHVDDAHGDLRVKSGSGEVRVGRAAGQLAVSTGSGDVEIAATLGPASVKTGSGDLRSPTPVTTSPSRPAAATWSSAGPPGDDYAQGRLQRRPGRDPGRHAGVDRRVHALRGHPERPRQHRRARRGRRPHRAARQDRQRGRRPPPGLSRPDPPPSIRARTPRRPP